MFIEENPPKIDRVRYLVRYNVTRGADPKEADFDHAEKLSEGYLKDGSFKQTVTSNGVTRQRYIKVFESQDEATDWSRAKTESLKGGKRKFYVHGSVQAFIGSIKSLKLSNEGGGGTVEGKITRAAGIWSTGNVNKQGGLAEVDNRLRDAFEEVHKLRMKEYRAFTNLSKGQKGTKFEPRIYTEEEKPPVATTPSGLEIYRTDRGAYVHNTESGIVYHKHKGSTLWISKKRKVKLKKS